MERLEYDQLLNAGVHFGHLKKKWNPKMRQYIFMERNGKHIIDLNKTISCSDKAAKAMKQIVKSGRKILFVATKKQARDTVAKMAQSVNMPYVTERWLGGMMTNFSTIRKSVKKMQTIERMLNDGSLTSVTKKEKLTLTRERDKLNKVLGGIANLNRIPSAIFIVDTPKEHIALTEARKLGMTVFALVDTNADPGQVDFPIPANDDSSKSINLLTSFLTDAIKEGLEERKSAKESKESAPEAKATAK
ncbi:MAG: 30S ribosomal protein S2 [Bacteroidia bacterium]|nr:30S ribosomal protein S2 [Bacteroidia bacterium]